MALFSMAAAFVCFGGAFVNNSDMTLPLVLLIFWLAISISWQYVKRKNERRWGVAKRTGREVFRIGMSQPTEEERKGRQDGAGKNNQEEKKNKPAKKGNYKR